MPTRLILCFSIFSLMTISSACTEGDFGDGGDNGGCPDGSVFDEDRQICVDDGSGGGQCESGSRICESGGPCVDNDIACPNDGNDNCPAGSRRCETSGPCVDDSVSCSGNNGGGGGGSITIVVETTNDVNVDDFRLNGEFIPAGTDYGDNPWYEPLDERDGSRITFTVSESRLASDFNIDDELRGVRFNTYYIRSGENNLCRNGNLTAYAEVRYDGRTYTTSDNEIDIVNVSWPGDFGCSAIVCFSGSCPNSLNLN